jgi:single-stranded-DNA-specific exonuclease
MSKEQLDGFIETDGVLAPEVFSLELAEVLKNAGPWGQAFPEPLFDGQFEVLNQQILAEKHVKCSVRPIGTEKVLEAIAFFVDFETWPKAAQTVHMVYRLDVNEFRGQKKLQLIIEHCFFV